jgi:hypothetical protein
MFLKININLINYSYEKEKIAYIIRLMGVSLKWTWRAMIMIPKEIFSGPTPMRKKESQYR